jgi:SPX domain protein involved in polyphosphate accumulation
MSGDGTEYRYERKFVCRGLDAKHITHRIRLLPAMFVDRYPPRYVNSLYLDSPCLRSYHENLDGVCDRLKTRIRWYGDLIGQHSDAFLELKVKKGLVGTKRRYALPPFTLRNQNKLAMLKQMYMCDMLPEHILERCKGLIPSLITRYFRSYHETPDGSLRITVDSQLSYYDIYHLSRPRHVSYDRIILEMKYSSNDERRATEISQYLRLLLEKNSKYVNAVRAIHTTG